jgi:hypothetical protein
MYKVWYRNGGQLDVDVMTDPTAALRRGAAIATDRIGSTLEFVAIENDRGELLAPDEFSHYLNGYRSRGLAKKAAVCPKYFVEVRAPQAVQSSDLDRWVRYAIETTRVRAERRALEAIAVFGVGRVRVTPVTTRSEVEAAVG